MVSEVTSTGATVDPITLAGAAEEILTKAVGKQAAFETLKAAIVNLVTHGCSLSSEFPRFGAWVGENQVEVLCEPIIRKGFEG